MMKKIFFIIGNFIFTLFIAGNLCADTTYIVRKGDNPSTIAKKFGISSKDILKANNINPKKIRPGTKLTIPSAQKESKDKNKSDLKNKKKSSLVDVETRGTAEDSLTHTVKKGDTLYTISKKYSTTVDNIMEINNLDSSKLKPGQQIVIKKTNTKSYTVRRGDSLHRIAKKFDVDIEDLREINELKTDSLKPGQIILLEHSIVLDEAKTYDTFMSQGQPVNREEPVIVSEQNDLDGAGVRDRLILFAKKLLNIPYRFGGNSLLGIDCSAYVKKVYSLIGVELPRSARAQFEEGDPIDKDDLSIGDLVFFRTYASFPSHVGIYLGNNMFIHASSKSRKVTIDSLETPYYFKRFIGAKRLLDFDEEDQKTRDRG